jgi:hypothetical protein
MANLDPTVYSMVDLGRYQEEMDHYGCKYFDHENRSSNRISAAAVDSAKISQQTCQNTQLKMF